MKEIVPYTDISEAITTLDNGGRFYNVLTKADDGTISPAELGKTAGLFNDKQQMVLFLEMAISKLPDEEKQKLFARLDDELKEIYNQHKPHYLLPSEVHKTGVLAANTILTGVPTLIDSKSDFIGFIMIPIMTGKVMTFTMIPMIDEYDVYELRDEITSDTFIIAHARNKEKLPKQKVEVAGVLKELKNEENESAASRKFLEVVYYMTTSS